MSHRAEPPLGEPPTRCRTAARGPSSAHPACPLRVAARCPNEKFVVRCGTGNSIYWDNNGWQNYFIGQGAGTILTSGNVYGTGYTASQGTYQGKMTSSVTLRNLAYAKQVKVVYTTDDWATVREAYASYSPSFWAYTTTPNPNAAGFEEWSFSLDVGGASSVEYAIAYTADGQTYWDNNFGENYVTNLSSY